MPVNINSVIVVQGVANANKLQQTLSNVVRKGLTGTIDQELNKIFLRNSKGFVTNLQKALAGLGRTSVSDSTIKNLTSLQTILRSVGGKGSSGLKEVSDVLGKVLPQDARKAQQAVQIATRLINQLRDGITSGNTGKASRAASRTEEILRLDPDKLKGNFGFFRRTLESEFNRFVKDYERTVVKSSNDLAKETQKLAEATDPSKIAARTQSVTRGAQARELRSLLDSRFETLKRLRDAVDKSVSAGTSDPALLKTVNEELEQTRSRRASLPTSQQELKDPGLDFQKEIDNERKQLEATRKTSNAIRSNIEQTETREKDAARQRASDAKKFADGKIALDKFVAKADEKAAADQVRRDKDRNDLRTKIAKRYLADQAAIRKEQAAAAKENERNVTRAIRLAERYKVVLADAINTSAKLNRPISREAQQLKSRIAELEDFSRTGGAAPPGGGPPNKPPNNPPFDDDRLARFVREQNKLNKSIAEGKFTIEGFGKAAALAAKRYAAFIVGSAVFFRLSLAFSEATRNAIEFESIITKIQQVIGTTNERVASIGDAIRDVAAETGVAAEEIGRGVLIFAQAGIKEVEQLKAVSDALAKTRLDATFDSIEQTSEGLLALFGQFNKDLTNTVEILDLVRQFSADFAVESKDIFEGVKRGGAVFSVAGGSIEEFISLFSILRERSRESASTLGVFFKTGITQLLSPKSQTIIRRLGIEANTTVGQLRELSEVFFGISSSLSDGDRVNLANQLVGQRQISKLLTLLQALNDPAIKDRVATAFELAPGSLDRATAVRLDDIGQSLQRIAQSFGDVIKTFTQNEGLKVIVSTFADMTASIRDFIRFAGPAIPILTAIAAISGAKIVGRGVKAGVNFAVGRPQSAFGAFLGGVNRGLSDVTGVGFAGNTRTRRERLANDPLVKQRTALLRQLNAATSAADIAVLKAARDNLRDTIRRKTNVGSRSRSVLANGAGGLLVAGGALSLLNDQIEAPEVPSSIFSAKDALSAGSGALFGAGTGFAFSGGNPLAIGAVSYTHLTLPTIYSV